MIKIKSLRKLSLNQLFEAFENAFADYDMQLNQNQLEAMLIRRGFHPELSFGAFDNDKLVSFTFNGIGTFNDKLTAYDTGTGTTQNYRGQGLAKNIFIYSIPYLKQAGIEQYLLEVLQHNEKAFQLYKKMGFEILRSFNYYVGNKNILAFQKQKNLSEFLLTENIDYNSIINKEFWDFTPSWQNSLSSVLRMPIVFRSIGFTYQNNLVAYCIFEPQSGDITQIAVHSEYRRQGLGSWLLQEAFRRIPGESFKIINTDTTCNTITAFLDYLQLKPSGQQYEMIKIL